MLERDSIYRDPLDRIKNLEVKVSDFREVSRPTEVIIQGPEDDWQMIAGWVSTGTVLRSINGEIVLDPTIPMIRIGDDGIIQSEDYSAGTDGFSIDGGTAEFNDVTVRGTIYADAGEIGGWTITANTIESGDITLDPTTPAFLLGSATDYLTGEGVWMGNDAGTYKIHIGDPGGDHMYWDGSELYVTGTFVGDSDISNTDANSFTINADDDNVTVSLIFKHPTADLNLDWDGAELRSDGPIYVRNLAVDTTEDYQAFRSYIQKTAGVTDSADDFYSANLYAELDQAGGTIGYLAGVYSVARAVDGTVSYDVEGMHSEAEIDGATVSGEVYGTYSFANVDSGTVDHIYGLLARVDLEAGMTVNNDVYGVYVDVDADTDPSGSAYMIYLDEADNVDYAIYHDGTATSRFGGSVQIAVEEIPEALLVTVVGDEDVFEVDTDSGVVKLGTGIDLQGGDETEITTVAGDLILSPAVDVLTDSDMEADNFVSRTTGWQITHAGAADFRSIYADELSVQSFTAQVYRAFAGGIIITESRAEVTRDFTIPDTGNTATLYVSDHEGALNTAVFSANDYVMLRVFDYSLGGLIVTDVFGQVTSHNPLFLNDGEQSWTWTTTTTGYSASDVIYAGSIALDYGSSGSGVWEATVLDAAGSPYTQIQTWSGVASGEPDTFTTHVRLGNLDGISGIGAEYGLWAGQGTANDDPQVIVTDTQATLRNIDIVLHNGANEVLWLDVTSRYIAINDQTFGNEGIQLQYNAGTPRAYIGDGSDEYLEYDGTNISWSAAHTVLTAGGDVWFGDTSSTERLEWSAAGLSVYDKDNDPVFRVDPTNSRFAFGADISNEDTTALVIFGEDGESYSGETFDENDLLIGDPDQGNVFWDKSAGQIKFRGGTSVEAYIDTDGAITAGSGNVWLDSDGVGILAPASMARASYVQWNIAAGNFRARVGSNSAGTLFVQALTDIDIGLFDGSSTTTQLITASSSHVTITTDGRVGGGLYVGAVLTDPDADDIWLDGDIRGAGGAYFGGTVASDDPGAGYVVAANGVSGWLPFAVHQCLPYAMTTASNDSEAPFAATVGRVMTVDHWTQLVYVDTTNNGANYWTITLREADGDVIETLTTASISADTTESLSATGIDHDLDPSNAGEEGVFIRIDATGSPGALYLYGPAVYVL